MKQFREFIREREGRKETDDLQLHEVSRTNKVEAMQAVVKALRPVTHKYTPSTMINVFDALCSKKGKELLEDFARRPTPSISKFKQLL